MNADWVPLKRIASLNPETLGEDTGPGTEFRYIDIATTGRGRLVCDPEPMTFESAPSRARRVLRQGDTILSTVRTYLRAVWTLREREADLVASTGFVCLRPTPGTEPRYLGWLAQSHLVVEEVVARSVGVSYPAINPSDVGLVKVPLRAFDEQRAIADYLDRETARIDALAAAKQRLAAALHERWMSAIHHRTFAVLETVPRVQLRRIGALQAGAAFPHGEQGDLDGTIPYVKVGDLQHVDDEDRLLGAANRVTSKVATMLRSPVLLAGTIVLPKIGAALLLNRRAVLAEPSCLDQNVMGVTVAVGDPRFVYYCLVGTDLGALSAPGPVPLLNEDAARAVRIPWPRTEVQREIATGLDSYRRLIQTPLSVLERQLDLLTERRQALITSAVTGPMQVPVAS